VDTDAVRGQLCNRSSVRPVSTILDRFRRSVAAPPPAGDDLLRELGPLFAALDEVEEEGDRLRAEARAEAERRLDAARKEAARIAATYAERAEAERSRTADERRRAGEREARAVLEAADKEARLIRDAGSKRIPELVAAVVACVKEGA
jgi:vacuolar-type H+-ATPase subunit H